MDTSRKMKRRRGWLLVAGVLVVLTVAVVLVALKGREWGETGAEWSQVIIQALAALGGLWFWVYRSRPRVTLRVGMRDSIYLDLANVGNRVARDVQVTCKPPIPMDTIMTNPQLGRLAKGGFGAPVSLFFPDPGAPS